MLPEHDEIPRRLFLKLTAATGTVAGLSSGALAQQSEIRLDGNRDGWVGRAPPAISGTSNPTLDLQAGETYTLTWTNVDGRPHNFVIADENGSEILRTDILEGEGESQTVEFEATGAMSTYYCEVHPESMRGSIATGADGAAGTDEAAGAEGTSVSISEGFSAGELSGDQFPEPVDTTGSGAALFGLAEDGSEIHYLLFVADLLNVTQAHVHVGGTDENGDVVAFLFGQRNDQGEFTGPLDQGVTENGVLASGTITSEDLVGPLEGESLETLIERFRSETAYVNVHTEEHPAGEIRGQIAPADAVDVSFTERVNASLSGTDGTLQLRTRVALEVTEGQAATEGGAATETPEGDQQVSSEGPLSITYDGTVAPGNRVTITVTVDGEPVADADVYTEDGDGERQLVGQTDENGQIEVVVPASGDKRGELSVKVRKGELEGELEVENED